MNSLLAGEADGAAGSGPAPFSEAPAPVEGALLSVAVPGVLGAPGPETPVPPVLGAPLRLEPAPPLAAPLPACAQANGAVARSATRPRETMQNLLGCHAELDDTRVGMNDSNLDAAGRRASRAQTARRVRPWE
ncbi:MAG TPA: hypothetical protein VFV05_15215 [Methylomirabilota bacterium]|nr:hypothetical protein [Methylomirabilota bacterium]